MAKITPVINILGLEKYTFKNHDSVPNQTKHQFNINIITATAKDINSKQRLN